MTGVMRVLATRIDRRIALAVAAGVLLLAAIVALRVVAMMPTPPSPAARVVSPPVRARPRPAAATPLPPSAAPRLVVRRVLDVASPMRLGQWTWDEAGVPAGPIIVTVDVAAGVLSIFRDGYEIGTAAIAYGVDAKPTPLGVYPVTQKDADHVSNLYDAPMPYMLRLTNDGVSIHGASVVPGHGTNGCIGVPTPFARKLFGAVKLGDPVIVTSGRRLAMGQPIGV